MKEKDTKKELQHTEKFRRAILRHLAVTLCGEWKPGSLTFRHLRKTISHISALHRSGRRILRGCSILGRCITVLLRGCLITSGWLVILGHISLRCVIVLGRRRVLGEAALLWMVAILLISATGLIAAVWRSGRLSITVLSVRLSAAVWWEAIWCAGICPVLIAKGGRCKLPV